MAGGVLFSQLRIVFYLLKISYSKAVTVKVHFSICDSRRGGNTRWMSFRLCITGVTLSGGVMTSKKEVIFSDNQRHV